MVLTSILEKSISLNFSGISGCLGSTIFSFSTFGAGEKPHVKTKFSSGTVSWLLLHPVSNKPPTNKVVKSQIFFILNIYLLT
jgi:hypothetical protein